MNRIELLKNEILEKRQARRIRIDGRKVYVDMQTANVCVQVHDALSDDNKVRFMTMPWDECVATAWRLMLRPTTRASV